MTTQIFLNQISIPEEGLRRQVEILEQTTLWFLFLRLVVHLFNKIAKTSIIFQHDIYIMHVLWKSNFSNFKRQFFFSARYAVFTTVDWLSTEFLVIKNVLNDENNPWNESCFIKIIENSLNAIQGRLPIKILQFNSLAGEMKTRFRFSFLSYLRFSLFELDD